MSVTTAPAIGWPVVKSFTTTTRLTAGAGWIGAVGLEPQPNEVYVASAKNAEMPRIVRSSWGRLELNVISIRACREIRRAGGRRVSRCFRRDRSRAGQQSGEKRIVAGRSRGRCNRLSRLRDRDLDAI